MANVITKKFLNIFIALFIAIFYATPVIASTECGNVKESNLHEGEPFTSLFPNFLEDEKNENCIGTSSFTNFLEGEKREFSTSTSPFPSFEDEDSENCIGASPSNFFKGEKREISTSTSPFPNFLEDGGIEHSIATNSGVRPLLDDNKIIVNYTCNEPEKLKITSSIESRSNFLLDYYKVFDSNTIKRLASTKVSFFKNNQEVEFYFYCDNGKFIRALEDDESITIHFTLDDLNIDDDKILVNYTCNVLGALNNINSIENRSGFKLDVDKILKLTADDDITNITITRKFINSVKTCSYKLGDEISANEYVKSITVNFTIDTPMPDKILVYVVPVDYKLPINVVRRPYCIKNPLLIKPESWIKFNEIVAKGFNGINIDATRFYQQGFDVNSYTIDDTVFIDKNVESITIKIYFAD